MEKLKVWLGLLVLGGLVGAGPAWSAGKAVENLNLEVSADFDYDFNATQQPNSRTAAVLVPRRGSAVYTQAAKVEYDFFPKDRFDMVARYNFFQNFHPRVSTVDTMMHTWVLSPSYSFGASRSTKLWVDCGFNYTDVASDKYYTIFTVTPTLFHRISRSMGAAAEVRLERKYGWLPQLLPQFFDYTSHNVGTSLGYYYFLGDQGGYLQARFSYDHYAARGGNNDASSYRLLFSGEYPFTSQFKVLLYLDMGLWPYENRFQDGTATVYPDRYDKILTFGAIAYYEFAKGWTASMHFYLTRQGSNIALYNYITQILGVQLAYHY